MTSSHKKDFDALANAYMNIFEGKSEFKPCSHCNHESKCIEAGKCLRDEDNVQEKVDDVESSTETAINAATETAEAEEEAKATGKQLPKQVKDMKNLSSKYLDSKKAELSAKMQ